MKVITLSMLASSLVGCGKVSLEMKNVMPTTQPTVKLSRGAEFVAASQQGQRTVNNFVVEASAGAVFNNVETSTPNGYKVYANVQGAIISEEKAKEAATR